MINHYELADVLELGTAQDLILGNKEIAAEVDSITLQFGTRVYDSMDDAND
jgi:hypothetical protein